jgi:REP-associated tyrosine transposase
MSKPPRDHVAFGTNVYSVTASAWGHRSLFQSERMANLLINTLTHYRREQKYLLHEFVVMPDHMHVIFTPCGITLESAMQFVKGGFSYRVKQVLGIDAEVWERGYVDHRIHDANDYDQHVLYVRNNPVQAGLVKLAEEYPYSSAHQGIELDPGPQGLKPRISKTAYRHG